MKNNKIIVLVYSYILLVLNFSSNNVVHLYVCFAAIR
jgi:hypothetical protein